MSKLKHSPRFFPSYFTLVQFWIMLSSFTFAFNLWKERPRGCSIKLVLLSCDRERFNQCWQETRKPFDIEPRAYGLFMLTMNGWWLKNHRKEYQGSWKTPHFLFTTAFYLWRACSRSSVIIFSIKRLLLGNFALCNLISPIGRSFVDVCFPVRFWQVNTRQQLRANDS